MYVKLQVELTKVDQQQHINICMQVAIKLFLHSHVIIGRLSESDLVCKDKIAAIIRLLIEMYKAPK